ncbi:ABC transporter ATP-binding protein [Streptomyces sp. NPDC004787]|uniref:ABC transporter ATP-binding protein n=1 Tax=Streptomyces sp. NPDC004787 TaxID=3154291 RepID=UPI0033BB2D70
MTSTSFPSAGPTDHARPDRPAVRLRGLWRLHRDVRALDGVDLDLPAGSFTAVMGPSGSGKSTLLQCAAGLDRPTAGTVEIDGVPLTGLSERRLTLLRRDRIGFVFQSFNLLPSLTAAQNVALPLRLAGRRPSRAQVREALARVGLAGRERHRPAELSGGQQQRVALARALITRPAVLFGDEPTGALDSTTGRAVLDLLRELVDRDGLTLVMVTHDPVAAARADRVVFLVDGRLAGTQDAPTAEAVAARMAGLEASVQTGATATATAATTAEAGAPC